jgi:uncharacterized protein YrrD
MTRRAKDLIGKPVVSAANGERLGTVTDLLLDDAGTSLVGLVLSHGFMKGEQVLPAESLQTLGTDAVVSRSNEVVGAKEWHERQRVSARTAADAAATRSDFVDETGQSADRVRPVHRDEAI